jgi:hypothetical protein
LFDRFVIRIAERGTNLLEQDMSSNNEWQKQYTRQRIDARLQEAEAHRLAKLGRAGRHSSGRSPDRAGHGRIYFPIQLIQLLFDRFVIQLAEGAKT